MPILIGNILNFILKLLLEDRHWLVMS